MPVRDEKWVAEVEVVPGLYYVNAVEAWISTMETQTVAGRNVANLIWNRWEKNRVGDE